MFWLSPALVDVDVVDFFGTDGDLGQGLDHVVALQHHVPLGVKRHTQHSLLLHKSNGNISQEALVTRLWSRLLFVVLTGHVQNKQAVAERADGDA